MQPLLSLPCAKCLPQDWGYMGIRSGQREKGMRVENIAQGKEWRVG